MSARRHQVNVSLSDAERKRLEEIAREKGIKTTEVLRYMLWAGTDTQKKEKASP